MNKSRQILKGNINLEKKNPHLLSFPTFQLPMRAGQSHRGKGGSNSDSSLSVLPKKTELGATRITRQ